jgi:[acyl-carrier-protein] S-malonyltransferase
MKIAWVFPGQGAQKVSMGRDVCERYDSARKVFQAADAELGSPLSKLCFEGPESELTLTANTQPAILTTSTALLAALWEAHPNLPKPIAAAGHSLGEYSALVAAGALEFEDAVRIVRLRGEAMQRAVAPGEGAMVALMGAEPDQVDELCEEARGDGVLSPANFNCPGQIVIAGAAAAAERAVGLAKKRKMRAIPLKVSAPFHCSLMQPAAVEVATALEGVRVSPLAFPVISNVEALPNQDPARVVDLLVRQVDGAVRWQQSLRWMAESGVTHALEIGPGQVLAGLMKKSEKSIQVLSVRDVESIGQVPAFLSQ